MEEDEPKLFKHMKDTPRVREKLKYIERLDDEIKETIQVYKVKLECNFMVILTSNRLSRNIPYAILFVSNLEHQLVIQ